MRVSGAGVRLAAGVGDATLVGVIGRGVRVRVGGTVGVDWTIWTAFSHPATRPASITLPTSAVTITRERDPRIRVNMDG
jgi:hypothetical protein